MEKYIQSSYISTEMWQQMSNEDKQRIIKAVDEAWRREENPDTALLKVKNTFYVKYGKRFLDILISGIVLLMTIPINAVIMVVTYFDVGNPIIFRQERIGRNEHTFFLCKFRNMTNEKNAYGELLPPADRVTKWGKFVRKTSLDELLNFWSILKGDMSIIGPRPLPLKYLERFSLYHKQRHLVRPGLECPFHDAKFASEGWQGRFDNDIWYVQNISFLTDMKMIGLLVKKVFSRAERSASAAGSTGEFIGYHHDGRVMDDSTIPLEYLKFVDKIGANEK